MAIRSVAQGIWGAAASQEPPGGPSLVAHRVARVLRPVTMAAVLIWFGVAPLPGQIRVTPHPPPPRPKGMPGYMPIAKPWENVPATFHNIYKFPEWPVPTDLEDWEKHRREQTLQQVLKLLGDRPPRRVPPRAKVTRTEDRGDHVAEYFELDNGYDMIITGLLLRPKGLKARAPAIVAIHGWSGYKDNLLTRVGHYDELVGPMLVKRGYVVAAIDAYFQGDRLGKGPNDMRTIRQLKDNPQRIKMLQVRALVGINALFGRPMLGMVVRDQQCLIDYLQSRPEVDPDRIGVTGMSYGNSTGYWLTAIDPRVKAFVGVACFTRLQQLIQQGYAHYHAMNYYVTGMLKHFDTEALFALIAPRPMLQLNGDSDPSCPVDGIEILERKVGAVYRMYGKPEHFQSVVYRDTGHIYLPDMKRRMLAWFLKYLPPDAASRPQPR